MDKRMQAKQLFLSLQSKMPFPSWAWLWSFEHGCGQSWAWLWSFEHGCGGLNFWLKVEHGLSTAVVKIEHGRGHLSTAVPESLKVFHHFLSATPVLDPPRPFQKPHKNNILPRPCEKWPRPWSNSPATTAVLHLTTTVVSFLVAQFCSGLYLQPFLPTFWVVQMETREGRSGDLWRRPTNDFISFSLIS